MQAASSLDPVPSVAVAFAARMVRRSQARPGDRILIVGPCQSDVLLDLYRRGFAEVCHQTGDRLPAHEEFDVAWLLHVESEPSLRRTLTALNRILRPGGTIVVRAALPPALDREALRIRDIRRCFAACGLVPLIQASDGDNGVLLSAIRPTADALRWPVTA